MRNSKLAATTWQSGNKLSVWLYLPQRRNRQQSIGLELCFPIMMILCHIKVRANFQVRAFENTCIRRYRNINMADILLLSKSHTYCGGFNTFPFYQWGHSSLRLPVPRTVCSSNKSLLRYLVLKNSLQCDYLTATILLRTYIQPYLELTLNLPYLLMYIPGGHT